MIDADKSDRLASLSNYVIESTAVPHPWDILIAHNYASRQGRIKKGDLWNIPRSSPREYSRLLGFETFDAIYPQLYHGEKLNDIKEYGIHSFLRAFFEAFYTSQDPFSRFVRRMQKERGEIRVLDLMSYGSVPRSLGLPGVSLGLIDHRSRREKAKDVKQNRVMVAGDILAPSTWEKLKEVSPEPFDLVTCAPNGGMMVIPENIALYGVLMDRVYPFISRDNGVLITNIHGKISPRVRELSDQLNQVSGLQTFIGKPDYGYSNELTFAMIKGPEAPEVLPRLLSTSHILGKSPVLSAP